MGKENQRRLYEHFLRQIENPGNPEIRGQDLTFIKKQAIAQAAAIDKVYNFSGEKAKPVEVKPKGKK